MRRMPTEPGNVRMACFFKPAKTCEMVGNRPQPRLARAGRSFNRSLWYVRGLTLAFGDNMKVTTNAPRDGVVPNPAFRVVGPAVKTPPRTRSGWTIGLGSAFALDRNWTVRGRDELFRYGDCALHLPSSTIDVAKPDSSAPSA